MRSKNGKTAEKTNPDHDYCGDGWDAGAVRISLYESVSARLALMDESHQRLVYTLLEVVGALIEGDRLSGQRLVRLMRIVSPSGALTRSRSRRR